ncbi:MAG: Na/Pi cotransporter family protein [Bacteriovoracaceae bacterium]|nr:Na/Pi cotransporter family protein [Bacteriovoracaceae bacterium]
MEVFTIIYSLLGGLGIFFFGMKLMSDGLQAMAGDMIRNIINSITANRVMAVGVGLGVTMLVQSSSITTVMTVGMVNAGLMTLKQAIGVILGANIGTTITGWIISIKVDKYGLLLVGLGFIPGLFGKSSKTQHIGKAILGIGMVFIGLTTMSHAFVPLRESQSFLNSIAYFAGDNYQAYLASVLMGCALTMVVQSSSAMLGITMALATTGVINYHTAVALVLGENIGTTITAILASIGASVNARRAARAHATFNILGVMIMLLILPYYFDFIEWMVPSDASFKNPDGTQPNVGAHIAMAHTMFNVTATLAMLPFLNTLAAFVTRITPDDSKEKAVPHLVLLGNPQDLLPATSLIQAESEIKKMADIVSRMYKITREYWHEDQEDPKKLAKILDYERITDNIHKEVTVFLCYVMERPLSHQQSGETQNLIKIADELESCADYLERLAMYRERFRGGDSLEGESRTEFFNFMDEVQSFFALTIAGLEKAAHYNKTGIFTKSQELQIWADSIRDNHLNRISKGVYKPVTALTFSDMVVALRKIRTHAFRMSESVGALYVKTE